MPLDQFVPFLSPAIALAGFVVVIFQLRRGTKQRELDSLVRLYDINRQLITLGFSNRELFSILADAEDADRTSERRYLQLWLNQFSLIHSYMSSSVFKRELEDSLLRDVAEFMTMENMRRHWRHHGSFYPLSFQRFIGDILKQQAQPGSGG